MTTQGWNRVRAVTTALVVALVVASATFGISSLARPQTAPGFTLTSSPSSFTITSAVYASPACSGSAAVLFPGVVRCAVFHVVSSLGVPMTVTSITTSFDPNYPAPPAQCSGTNFTLPTFSGSLAVPASGSADTPGVTIELNESGADQDACQNLIYHFLYSGTAKFTDSTTTSLASTPEPSAFGTPVTFTATVTAANPSLDGNPPSGEPSPGNQVTFYSCTTVACTTKTMLGTGTIGSGGKATYTSSSLPAGVDYVEAVYPGSGTDFSASTSNVVTQRVVGVTLTSSPNPSTFGQSVTLRATVVPSTGPTGTVTFYLGTPSGSHVVLKSGVALGTGNVATYSTPSLPPGADNLYAVYSGDSTYPGATSAVITQQVNLAGVCVAGKVNGGYVVKAGTAICITATINGGLTVQAGAAVELLGGVVNGGISAGGATAIRICGSTINGGITASGTTGSIVIGDYGDDGPPGCAGNTINGNVTLTNNLGGVEFAKNSVIGTVTLSGNSGGGLISEDSAPEVEGNTIAGSLACTGNSPAPTNGGQGNVVTVGTKTGQCAGF